LWLSGSDTSTIYHFGSRDTGDAYLTLAVKSY